MVTVQAEWDVEAGVWGIHSDDVPGLHIEADTYDEIEGKAVAAIQDLAEYNPAVAALVTDSLVITTTRHVERAVA